MRLTLPVTTILERGMILLILSKEVMLSIPNSMAIARAEQTTDNPVRQRKRCRNLLLKSPRKPLLLLWEPLKPK